MKFKRRLLVASMLTMGMCASIQAASQQSIPNTPHEHAHHAVPTMTDERSPLAESPVREDANLQNHQPNMAFRTMAAAATCDVNAFATSNSRTLITEIKKQGFYCVNELFSASSSVQERTFSSDNMYSVANEARGMSSRYQGTGDAELQSIFLYLRAGYYVEYNNSRVSFISWVKPAVKNAIDAFVNNSNFYNNDNNHGLVLREVLSTMDGSQQQDVYLPVVKAWLSRWNQSYLVNDNMARGVSQINNILWRGQWNANFRAKVSNDRDLVIKLRDFVTRSYMIGSTAEFLARDAAGELARFKSRPYQGAAIQSDVDSALNYIFNSSGFRKVGHGDAVWIKAAHISSYYSQCSTYNICGWRETIKAQTLPQTYNCTGIDITVRSQDLTAKQQRSACAVMATEEGYFHTKLSTGSQPVADDNNTHLQINIWNTKQDYQKYSEGAFANDTNNGGMYLEGDPSKPGNVPNFVAHEADYANLDHLIWNLEHEYVHYLDGRFDLYGDYNAPPRTTPIVWWSEGVAEYISKKDNNQRAIDTINDGSTFTLSQVINTTYDGFDQDRIYRWGYLAVRFMYERYYNELQSMLNETRAGNWTAYKTRVDRWGSYYGNEFATWTRGLTNTTPPPTGNVAPVAVVNGPYSAATGDVVNFSSRGSNDSDGRIVSYHWDFGDGNVSSDPDPVHTYTRKGNFTVKLTVTDDGRKTGADSTTASIGGTTPPPPVGNLPDVCASAGPQTGGTLTAGRAICVGSGDPVWFNVAEVNSHSSIRIMTGHGQNDLNIDYKNGGWPTDTSYDGRSANAGNNECIFLTNQSQYWGYIKVYGSATGASMRVDFDTSGCP